MEGGECTERGNRKKKEKRGNKDRNKESEVSSRREGKVDKMENRDVCGGG